MIAQSLAVLDQPAITIGRIGGMSILAGLVAGSIAMSYRWYTRERIQRGLPVLAGLAVVAVYAQTRTALGQVISPTAGDPNPLSPETAITNIALFLLAGLVSVSAVRIGDRLGTDLFAATSGREVDGEVSRVVEAVGRVIAVSLPEEIDDVAGYDPVSDETKTAVAGRTFLFPRRLTVAELEARLTARLRSDYGVGRVDVDLAADGTVEYLAIGARVAGIGPTLPPETAAVAVRADPAFAAGPGDLVQVRDPTSGERVTTAEIRGVAEDVVTLAVDAADAPTLDDETRYRLVTLPVETRADREFASLLRAAEETIRVVPVAAGSDLAGQPVGAIDVSIIAIKRDGDGVEAIPQRTRVLDPGDALYAVGTPEQLRKLEAAGAGDEPAAAVPEPSSVGDDDD